MIFVKLAPGADPATVQERIETVIDSDFPTVEVLDQDELKDRFEEQIDQLLNLLYALLSLAVIVASSASSTR